MCAVNIAATPDARSEINTAAWDDLSDKDISPEGRVALSLNENPWEHAETEHFVYHFTDDKAADTVYIHSEVYYNWIKEFFGVSEDKWSKKNHIFIFTGDDSWKDFLKRLNREGFPEAFTTGWELFINRKPLWVSPRTSLAHELTHVIVFKFAEGPLPLFLNEGFANFVSYQLVNMQLDNMGYRMPYIRPLSEDDYIPLKEIAEMIAYPADRVDVFYRESEWLVRYLINIYGKEKFYGLLKACAGGEGFNAAVEKVYGIGWDDLEIKFRQYAKSGK